MKKGFILTILSIFLVGCTKNQEKVKTIIEQNENSKISIHYPITNIKKMDKNIQEYVDHIYNDFKKEYTSEFYYEPELNIDYTYYNYENKIHTVSLKTYMNHEEQPPIEEIKCITYDQTKKRELFLSDLIEKEKWNPFIEIIRKEILTNYQTTINLNRLEEILKKLSEKFQNFTFNEDKLIMYLNTENLLKSDKEFFQITLEIKEIPFILEQSIKIDEEQEVIKPVDFIVDPEKPYIALTFDDGPTIYTEKILDILQKESVQATFFVLGNKVDMFKDDLKREVKLGNEIGNHSYNHKWLSRLPKEEIKEQIEKTQEKVKDITGIYPRFLRPTYGSINERIRTASNLNIVLWDIDPKDWKSQSPENIVERILKKAESGKIILLHDNHKRTVEAVQLLIPELKKQGYQLLTLSEMEEIKELEKWR